MKIAIIFITTVFFLFACDKRKDFFTEKNTPIISYVHLNNSHSHISGNVNGYTVTDTLKLGFDYSFEIDLNDQGLIKSEFSGAGSLYKNISGTFSSFTSSDLNSGLHQFKWTGLNLGENNFQLKFTDVYGELITYNFKIFVFENRTPLIDWTLVHIGNLSNLHKRFIITGNDRDELYGGRILYYQIIINNDTTNYPASTMDYIFPSAGYFNIGIRAMDSNYEWSNFIQISNFYISG